jgi:arsenite methyltransferase
MEKDLQIKDKVKERYGKIALIYTMNSTAKLIDYNPTELESIPQSSILGVRCGNPTKFAHLNDGI